MAHQAQMEKHKEKPGPSFKLKKEMWKVLWKMRVPNKVRSFWWRTCNNILATKENLFKRKCARDNLCPICESEVESIEHLLFWCPWAESVWFGCNVKPFGNLGGNASVVKWVADMVDKLPIKEAETFMGKVANIAWHIWKTRNDFVFNGVKVNPLSTMASILHSELEFLKSLEILNVHVDNPKNQEDLSAWRAPDKGKLKVNCDVAIAESGLTCKASAVIRNWKGKLVDGMAKSVTVDSSLDGELQAIRVACEMTNALGLKEVVIESDNKQAISLGVSELVPPWRVSAVVQDIRHLAKEGCFLFKWVRRTANKVAHEVASLALRQKLPCNWVVNRPLSLVTSLQNDFNESQ